MAVKKDRTRDVLVRSNHPQIQVSVHEFTKGVLDELEKVVCQMLMADIVEIIGFSGHGSTEV